MPELSWSTEDLLGEPRLDREHQEMFALTQAVARAAPAEAEGLIGRLEDLARGHFEAEEARMRELGYYGAAAHRAEHRQLLEQLAALRASIPDPATAGARLADTLLRHIREVDRLFVRFLQGG